MSSAFALDPIEAVQSFEIHPDFQIELIASEPVIFDPVDLTFDERGRPFVVEMPGYPVPGTPGRVVMLGDADGDGLYESRTIFAEGFELADSVLAYDGGILVASPPDLIFLKDTDGDDVADVREVLLTGFALENPQHNFNGLNHGLDNWIYGANGGNGGSVYFPDDQANKTGLRFNDFRVDLRGKRFERIGRSSGGFELTLDAYGRIFTTHNLRPITHLVFPGRYLEGLPAPRSGTLASIPDDEENGLVRIYPIGPQDTRVNHPEQSGYFSGSCGITYYGGGAFGDEFNGNVFIMDVVLNLVHRRVLTPNGATFTATRGRDRVEFLASSDRGFRPVNATVAPDGSLWLLDMHRTIIEHPEWIPDELEEDMDLDEGKEAGRIYRITPKGGLLAVTPNFDRSRIAETVAALGHPNQWHRQTAQRLLVQWDDPGSLRPLRDVLANSDNALARQHALWTLRGLNALEPRQVEVALADPSPDVRENALIIAEEIVTESPQVRGAVIRLSDDDHPRVRLRTALALSRLPEGSATEAVIALARRDSGDPWMRMALLPALAKGPFAFSLVLGVDKEIESEERAEFLSMLARVIGESGSQETVEGFMALLSARADDEPPEVAVVLDSLAQGLASRGSTQSAIRNSDALSHWMGFLFDEPDLQVVRNTWLVADALGISPSTDQRRGLRAASRAVRDESRAVSERLDYLRLYEFAAPDERFRVLFELLDTRQPSELQIEAIEQLERAQNLDVARRIVSMWRSLGPSTRVQAGDLLLYHRGNHDLLLTALEEGTISLGELNLHLERRRTLLNSRQPGIAERAEALFSDAGVVTRREAIESMRPALALAGDSVRGKEIFAERCIQCHSMGAEGGDLGPNLGEIFRKSAETLLYDILDPNAAVESRFASYTIDLPDGDVLSGILVSDTGTEIAIRDATGKETSVRRDEMEGMYSDGLSLMPEELEADLDVQAMADLLAYLQEPK